MEGTFQLGKDLRVLAANYAPPTRFGSGTSREKLIPSSVAAKRVVNLLEYNTRGNDYESRVTLTPRRTRRVNQVFGFLTKAKRNTTR